MDRFTLIVRHAETGFESTDQFDAVDDAEAVLIARDVARAFLKGRPEASDAVMSVLSETGQPLIMAELSVARVGSH